MIKIKVFVTNEGWKQVGNRSFGVADFCYCVYFFGFLIHSVTVREIDHETANQMFAGLKVIANEHN